MHTPDAVESDRIGPDPAEPRGTSRAESTATQDQAEGTLPTSDDPHRLLISQMTLEEKIGQLIMAGFANTAEAEQIIRDLAPGGLILFRRNMSTEEQTRQDIALLKTAVPEHLPPLFVAVDQEGGLVTRLPASAGSFASARSIAQMADVAYAESFGERTGRILLDWGFNVNCAPVLDIDSNLDNPVIGTRAFGQTAEEVITYGMAVLRGLRQSGILPVAKHFPGHGAAATDSHLGLPVISQSLDELYQGALLPFIAAIDGGVGMVMVAHIQFSQLDERPASLSPLLVDGLLRQELGFSGVVLTDDLTMKAITDHYALGEAAVMAVEAGCDLLLVCHLAENVYRVHTALLEAVHSGRLSEARIDSSVARILELKNNLTEPD